MSYAIKKNIKIGLVSIILVSFSVMMYQLSSNQEYVVPEYLCGLLVWPFIILLAVNWMGNLTINSITKTIKSAGKIMCYSVLLGIGLIIAAAVAEWLSTLAATTIIIMLLVAILLK